ncbi:MAG: asparaginase [Pseudomonadota bacterium]
MNKPDARTPGLTYRQLYKTLKNRRVGITITLLIGTLAIQGYARGEVENAQSTELLPKIAVIGTGGTIAGLSNSDGGYVSAEVDIDAMLQGLTAARSLAQLTGIQISNIGSQDMSHAVWLKLLAEVQSQASSTDVDGIIITHGTDSLEETAFFLSHTYSGSKPVVLTAAMRPADALSADGPANITDAIKTALASRLAGGRVLVTMNGEIHEPRFVSKRHSENLGAIQSVNGSLAGEIVHGWPRFYGPQQCQKRKFTVRKSDTLPFVPIVYAHVDLRPEVVDLLVEAGAQGIVLAGYGNGNTSKPLLSALSRAGDAGVVIVRSTKVGSGFVSRNVEIDDDDLGFIASQDLSPQKARVLLALSILNEASAEDTQRFFFDQACSLANEL